MNRRELVKALAENIGHDVKNVEAVIRGFEDVVAAKISKGEAVVLSGFAKFARVDRKARMARNPQTGAPVKVAASRKVRVTALKGLKDVVAGKAPAPKLVAAKPLPTTKAAPAKKAPAAKKASPAKKAAPAKKAPAAKKATPVKKAPAAKKAAPAKKAPAAKKTAPVKKAAKKR